MLSQTTLRALKREYAKLIIRFGIRLKRGEIVDVDLPLDDLEFNQIVVEECYKAGASRVLINYIDEEMNQFHFRYGNKEELSKVYPYEIERYRFYKKAKAVKLHCFCHHYEAYKGIKPKLIGDINNKRREQIYEVFYDYSMHCRWSGFAIPNASWAKKIFPRCNEKDAINRLWEIIFKCCYVEEGKSVKNWEKHNADLKKRIEYLNSLKIRTLHYENSLGTDITIGVIPNSLFCGGTHPFKKGWYNPNFPTEEVFISPDRLKTNGIVYASKPLVINEKLIKGICFKFVDGRIVEVRAKQNETLLKKIISIGEGAHYLGEAAFVPYNSPISQTGLLFYNTLYDENASCHFAFGFGFPIAIPFGEKLNQHELLKLGINQSKIHIDFMIGTPDLKITAETRDNKKIVIFKNGNWAK